MPSTEELLRVAEDAVVFATQRVAELSTENERLRAELAVKQQVSDPAYFEVLKAEVERLKKDLDAAGKGVTAWQQMAWKEKAEAERLRAEVKGQKFATLGEWERLRAQVKLGEDIAHDLMLTQQEVERLRAALEEVRVLEQKAWVRGSSGGEVALRAIAIARQALEEK
jgi:hypothetical protein